MAHWRGDGRKLLGDAIREKKLERKVELLMQANLLLYQELEFALSNLGPENFCPTGLKEMKEEMKEEK